ncbi:MAG: hypothetical protein Q9172_003930 [Xanthocarpia lactea]
MASLLPSAGAGARLGLSLPFIDFDQVSYLVALRRAYCISFRDLAKSFNSRYNRLTTERELESFFGQWEKAVEGPRLMMHRDEFVDPFKFWPIDGFREHEIHKLFILATYLQAYDASIKLIEAERGTDVGPPVRPVSSNIRASKEGPISYEDISGSSSRSLMEMYNERIKDLEAKWKSGNVARTTWIQVEAT